MSLQMQTTGTQFSVARVNLLPAEVDAARGGRTLKVGLAAGLAVVGAFIAAGCVVTAGHVTQAQDALDAEQAKTTQLQRAQAAYAEVPEVLGQLRTAQAVDAVVSGSGLDSYALLDRVAATTPDGVQFTSIALKSQATASTTTAAGATAAATAAAGADPLAVSGRGTLSVTGQTTDQALVVAWMSQTDATDEFADVRLASSTLDPTTKLITFTATATVTVDETTAAASTGGATS
ncbi:PilN domain-containing protein [Kineococcus endophyticus]|uniref:PilN domain-containing protein n=1 Tax=Kineococcus endophyticus TaxID=1181883 RepID=A0ABV3PAL4_9ACTN